MDRRERNVAPSRTAAAFLALVWLVGCVTSRSPAASLIEEADDKMVSGCTYAGEVFGVSSMGGPDIGTENEKTKALEQAAEKHATHVVWNSLVAGKESSSVSGKAYRCASPAAIPRTP
ncbi:MAG TPA: hypothetical protein VFZ57_10910 [Thermoanaerobaculia bacterium]|nr:hypothetical protein [Thermoanaerobaculia bacterium]